MSFNKLGNRAIDVSSKEATPFAESYHRRSDGGNVKVHINQLYAALYGRLLLRHFPGDEQCHFKRLFVIQSRIHVALVRPFQIPGR